MWFSCSAMFSSCNPMDCSTTGFPVHYYLPEFAQTHVYWGDDAIQPFHHLLSPSPPAFNLPQHQDLFQRVNSSYQVAKILELQPQHLSFQWIFRIDFLWGWLVWSPYSPREGFPGGSVSLESACNAGDCLQHSRSGFDPWVRKIPWRRAWQPTLVFLSGESPWTEEPGRPQSMGWQRVRHDWATSLSLSL